MTSGFAVIPPSTFSDLIFTPLSFSIASRTSVALRTPMSRSTKFWTRERHLKRRRLESSTNNMCLILCQHFPGHAKGFTFVLYAVNPHTTPRADSSQCGANNPANAGTKYLKCIYKITNCNIEVKPPYTPPLSSTDLAIASVSDAEVIILPAQYDTIGTIDLHLLQLIPEPLDQRSGDHNGTL